MEFVRTIIRSEELTGIIEIPESLKSRLVEILILPCDDNIVQVPTNKSTKNVRGILANYKNRGLIKEEEKAFEKAMVNKHEDN